MQQPNGEMVDGYVLKKDFTWHDDTPIILKMPPAMLGLKIRSRLTKRAL
ncbi:hypothetical protein KUH03_35880 [Sphingobacterium sp. E70]|nr:hypothetical protein [Sphingobacterium sp. E70]ULT24342.1 hypothetical protein KUH03_35880 [Sphingobacterium sp. E70]